MAAKIPPVAIGAWVFCLGPLMFRAIWDGALSISPVAAVVGGKTGKPLSVMEENGPCIPKLGGSQQRPLAKTKTRGDGTDTCDTLTFDSVLASTRPWPSRPCRTNTSAATANCLSTGIARYDASDGVDGAHL